MNKQQINGQRINDEINTTGKHELAAMETMAKDKLNFLIFPYIGNLNNFSIHQ